MRTADTWDPPEDSTISSVAGRIIREQNQRAPNVFHFNADSAQRGRTNAGKTATARALARKISRG